MNKIKLELHKENILLKSIEFTYCDDTMMTSLIKSCRYDNLEINIPHVKMDTLDYCYINKRIRWSVDIHEVRVSDYVKTYYVSVDSLKLEIVEEPYDKLSQTQNEHLLETKYDDLRIKHGGMDCLTFHFVQIHEIPDFIKNFMLLYSSAVFSGYAYDHHRYLTSKFRQSLTNLWKKNKNRITKENLYASITNKKSWNLHELTEMLESNVEFTKGLLYLYGYVYNRKTQLYELDEELTMKYVNAASRINKLNK